jgi:hypothetical protein
MPVVATHIFDVSMWDGMYAQASEWRKAAMERYATGTRKFAQMFEVHFLSEGEPPRRAAYYSYHAASSRRIRIADGPSLWEEGQVVFVPPPFQSVAGTAPQVDISSLRGS